MKPVGKVLPTGVFLKKVTFFVALRKWWKLSADKLRQAMPECPDLVLTKKQNFLKKSVLFVGHLLDMG